MRWSRRSILTLMASSLAAGCLPGAKEPGVRLYVRYRHMGREGHGLLDGQVIRPITGDLFGNRILSGTPIEFDKVDLLTPVQPRNIVALAGNYESHLRTSAVPPHPEAFFKPVSSLQHPNGDIVMPPGVKDLHYEAELVIVIGREAHAVSVDEAPKYILGYTCGNDVSERNWQNGSIDGRNLKDKQWWRAKGSDTFSPVGPALAVGFDYTRSSVRSRLNGEVKQEAPLSQLIYGPAETVSYVTQYLTLQPGDLIFTGTPGRTERMAPGDVVEIEIDGIGVLRNQIRDPDH